MPCTEILGQRRRRLKYLYQKKELTVNFKSLEELLGRARITIKGIVIKNEKNTNLCAISLKNRTFIEDMNTDCWPKQGHNGALFSFETYLRVYGTGIIGSGRN